MKSHRNSQKRIYRNGAIYFVTFLTKNRYPYFSPKEPAHGVLCELFVEELRISKNLKGFELYGFCVMYDHVHLLLKPGAEYDISKCIQSIKKESSRDFNRLICPDVL